MYPIAVRHRHEWQPVRGLAHTKKARRQNDGICGRVLKLFYVKLSDTIDSFC